MAESFFDSLSEGQGQQNNLLARVLKLAKLETIRVLPKGQGNDSMMAVLSDRFPSGEYELILRGKEWYVAWKFNKRRESQIVEMSMWDSSGDFSFEGEIKIEVRDINGKVVGHAMIELGWELCSFSPYAAWRRVEAELLQIFAWKNSDWGKRRKGEEKLDDLDRPFLVDKDGLLVEIREYLDEDVEKWWERLEKLGITVAQLRTLIKLMKSALDYEMIRFGLERMKMMKPEILQEAFANPEEFVKNFEYGKYPLLKEIPPPGIPKKPKIEIVYNKGKFRDTKTGYVVKGLKDYIIIREGWRLRLYLGERHSYLAQRRNVEYAGEIKFTRHGQLVFLNNSSGHYEPLWEDRWKVVQYFNDEFWVDIKEKFRPWHKKRR